MEEDVVVNTEDADFAAGFAGDRGEVVEPEPEPEAEPETEPTEPEPAEPTTPEEAVRLIAGLTEEQLQAALAKSSTLQSTVDKMAGRMGQLMQQIDALKAAPAATPQAQHAIDLKLEKLSGSFPELANLLREDLAGMQGGAPATPMPAGMTQEQVDAILEARLSASNSAMNDKIEMKVLGIAHPDWLDVIKTPQFSLYLNNVLPAGEGAKVLESEDSSFISKNLTEFKAWRDKTAAPAVPTPPNPAAVRAASRLSNAVLPNGGAAPPAAGDLSEEQVFLKSFAAEQKKRGLV